MHYRGRFAPSPTGALHFGSLIAATASYLDARTHGGEWLLRIEDVDIDRCQPGATEEILRTLERFGFIWDGPVIRQALRNDTYELALTWLREQALAYPCACSRKEIAAQAARPAIDGGYVYPGNSAATDCSQTKSPEPAGFVLMTKISALSTGFRVP